MQATAQDWLPSSKSRPCPVCGRTSDGDCRISADGERVICHHPKDYRPGKDVVNGYAFTGNTSDGRAGHFTLDKPRNGSQTRRRKVVPLPVRPAAATLPDPATITLARLPGPQRQPPEHWPNGQKLPYGSDGRQWVKVNVAADGRKNPIPHHKDADGKTIGKAGPDPWPLWCQSMALEHGPGKWIAEAEGEKCAAWFHAAAVVAVSQPGHNHKPTDIERRYGELVAAGVAGVVYLADNDQEGSRKARKCADAAAAVGLPFLSIRSIDVWPAEMPAGGSIDDAKGTAAERVAQFEEHIQKLEPAQPAPPPQAEPQKAPFRILGWSVKHDAIWVQTTQTGGAFTIPPTKNGLQRIASLPYWEALYPSRNGLDWDRAISSICQEAHDLGQTFTPDRIRGRGVWLDDDRVVWHLGNRLEVDGQLQPLTALRDTGWTYASLPALAINPEVQPLTDAEGTAILDMIHKRMQWENAGDGLLIAGHAVLGNICGALDTRPGLQLTGPSQGGKSTTERTISRRLQGGLGVRPSGATEAGIRQRMQNDALPVVIDESEQESPKQREGHLKLLRLSFDGQEQIKGTAGGQALTYTMRSSITLIGINATVPNLADRNRLVVIRPRKMPSAQWSEFQLQRDALITVETGRRLIRRSVSNLKALVANIETFQAVISANLSGRSAEVYGSLLAGAHHLTSTAVLAPHEALDWLDSVKWSGLDDETKEAIATDAEGLACLDHLLGHSVIWKGSQTGSIAVLELLKIAQGLSQTMGEEKASELNKAEAVKALGRLGVKLDNELGLVVSKVCTVFSSTRWVNGAHHDRLLELKGAKPLASPVRFPQGRNARGVSLPIELLDPEP